MQRAYLQSIQQCINFELGDYKSRQSKHSAWQTTNSLTSLLFRLFFPLFIARNYLWFSVRNGLLLLFETIHGFSAVVFAATMNGAERLSGCRTLFVELEEGIHVVCVSCQGVVKNFLVFFSGSFRRFIHCLSSGRLCRSHEWVVDLYSSRFSRYYKLVARELSRILTMSWVLSEDGLDWSTSAVSFRLLMSFLLKDGLKFTNLANLNRWRSLSLLVSDRIRLLAGCLTS